jgi:hypothetical protein
MNMLSSGGPILRLALMVIASIWLWRLGKAIGHRTWGVIAALGLLPSQLSLLLMMLDRVLGYPDLTVAGLYINVYSRSSQVQAVSNWIYWFALAVSAFLIKPRRV